MAEQTYTRYEAPLGQALTFAVTSTPAQISGGTAVLPGFTLAPSRYRQGLLVFNPNSAPCYVGIDNTVTGAGANAIYMIAAFASQVLPFNGTMPLWIVCASSVSAAIVEVQ